MGTDIHAVFQARKGGIWEDIVSPYDESRWYFLFAWLADVRNGFGFAGVRTGEPIKPISLPRGLPEDFHVEDGAHPIPSNAHRGRRAEWYAEEDADEKNTDRLRVWMGDHSFSWLTAEEILEAPNQPYQRCGIISRAEYEKWAINTSPESWCGGIGGPDIFVEDLELQTAHLGEKPALKDETTHVRVGWVGGLWDVFYEFRELVRKLKDEHGEVRMVFGFDS